MKARKPNPSPLSLGVVAFLCVFALTGVAHGATFYASDTYTLEQNELVEDDFYVAADTLDLFGRVDGDVFLAGNTLRVAGGVRDDTTIVAGKAALLGDYNDDVRIAAGSLAVASTTVAGDMLIAAGAVELKNDVSIDGDLVIVADSAIVDGTVSGTLRVYARQVELTGSTTGDVYVSVSESVALKDDVVVGGTFTYTAPRKALIADTATIVGEVVFTEVDRSGPSSETARLVLELFSVLLWAVSAIVLVFLFPVRVASVVTAVLDRQGLSVIVGLAAFGVVPFTALVLLFTGVGIPISVLILLLYVVGLLMSHLLIPVLAGVLILSLFNKENSVSVKTTLVGAGVVFLLNLLPVLGLIITVVLMLAVFGALLELLWKALRRTEEMPALPQDEEATTPSEGGDVSGESVDDTTHSVDEPSEDGAVNEQHEEDLSRDHSDRFEK